MKYVAFAAIVICLALYGWTVWYDRSLKADDPFGHRNLQECAKIRPGATEADLVRILGAPEKSEQVGGVRRLSFHTLGVATAPISADVDAATGAVRVLRCRDDGAAAWNLDR
jgi:hypothetical protein